MSTGVSARSTGDELVKGGVAEPSLTVAKSVAPATIAAGSMATFTITVTNAESTPETPTGPAYDVVVTDTLPAEMSPVTSSGSPMADGAVNASGLRWDATSRTMTKTVATIDAGATETLQVKVRLAADSAAATGFVNNVAATATSLPGVEASERAYPAVTANATLTSAAAAPVVTKTADRDSVVRGNVVNFTVTVALPANSHYDNVTLIDVLPDGMYYQWNQQVSCSGCTNALTTLDLGVDNPTPTTQRFAMYLGTIDTDAAPATLTWTYGGAANSNFNNGTAIPMGHEFVNASEFRANIVDRLGGVPPRLSTLRSADFQLPATKSVILGEPKLAISKRALVASPYDPADGPIEWEVTLTNSGNTAATHVYVWDNELSASPGMNVGQLQVLSDPADFETISSNMVVVRTVPAGGSFTYRYTMPWYPGEWIAYASNPYRIINSAYVGQYADPYGSWVGIPAEIRSNATVDLLSPDLTVTKERITPATVAIGTPIDYRITLTNNGLGSATSLVINDSLPAGLGPVSDLSSTPAGMVACTGTTSATCTLTPNRILPGQTVTFEYRVATTGATTGVKTNSVSVSYRDGAGRLGNQAPVSTPYTASASVSTTLVAPQMTLAKTPEIDDPGATIDVLGSAMFHMVATNTGDYFASNVVIDDPLPSHISADLASSSCTVFPASPSSGCVVGGTAAHPTFTVDTLAPGAEMRAHLAVVHDGSDPKIVGSDLPNVATLSALGFTSITDDGGLNVQSGPKPPMPTKSVSPTSASPGETVTYTVDVAFQSAAAQVIDATLIDIVPDGLENVTPVSITCVTGSCPSTLAYIGFEPSANGGGRAGWFLGDQPILTTGTVRIVYTATVASAFVGGGTPAAGTPVRDGVGTGDPLKNAARVWFNDGVDRFATAPPVVPAATTANFTNRSVNTRVSLDIATPVVDLTKTAEFSSVEAGDRTNPGSINTFTLTVRNTGSRDAYALDVTDSMGNGELRDVVFDALPSGVTVTDGWTLADPATTLRIDTVPAGGQVVITYTAVPRTTGEAFDSRWQIRNTAQIVNSHSTPGGTGAGDYSYGPGTSRIVDTWAFTPQPRVYASGCSDPDAIGDTVEFRVDLYNYHYLGTPDRADIGTLHDAVATVTLSSDVTFVPGSVKGTPYNGVEASFRDPDTLVVNGDGTTTMTWNVGDVAINNASRFLGLRWNVTASAISVSGPSIQLSGVDWSGSPSRGSAIAATTPYAASAGAGCSVAMNLQKSPDGGTVPAGNAVNWNASFSVSTPLRHAYAVSGSISDLLPKGFIYAPGTATFSDGTTAAAHSEVITPQPDGSTKITWSGFAITAQPASSASISVTIPTTTDTEAALTLDGALPRSFTNLAAFETTSPAAIGGTCGPFTSAFCDTGWVTVESNNQPTVAKSVDHAKGPWGDAATFTIDVSVPKNYAANGLFVYDQTNVSNPTSPFWPTNQPPVSIVPVSASCIAGCTAGGPDDITVTALPALSDGTLAAWKTGPVASDTEARTLRISYQMVTPEADVVYALPNCPSYGMAADTYYSCGVARFLNTVNLYNSNALLSGMGAGWQNNWWAYGMNHRGQATAAFTVSTPDVRITKTCHRPGEASTAPGTYGEPEPIKESALSVANVECELTVRNLGPGSAYYIDFDDRPSANSVYGYPVGWEMLSNSTPSPAIVDTAPTDGSKISWELPDLGAGETYTASFQARTSLPGWAAGLRVQSNAYFGTRFMNEARISSYDIDDFDTLSVTSVTGNRQSQTYLDLVSPRLYMTKQVNAVGSTDVGELTDDAHCYGWEQMTVDGHPVCFNQRDSRAPMDDGDSLEYHVNIGVENAEELRTINLTDRLARGWSYVPGTARLDHWSWDGSGNLVKTSTPLFEPTVTPNSPQQCYYWNIEQQGDQLLWVFSKAGTGQDAALWDPAMQWTGATNAGNFTFDRSYRISFEVAPNAEWSGCKSAAVWGWEPVGPTVPNYVLLEATTTSDQSGSTAASVQARSIDQPSFTKAPKNGTVTADSTAAFTMDLDFNQRFAIDDVKVTDTVQDWSVAAGAPLYQPGTATLTDELGDPVSFTENVVHRSTGPGDPSIIEWTFDLQPAYSQWEKWPDGSHQCPVAIPKDHPYWGQCASRVHIELPISVPDDEVDGYTYTNSATAEAPTATYSPTHPFYTTLGSFDYGFTLTDTGDLRVVNPSPAPTPSKSGPWMVTPNDAADYYINFMLPAGTVYHDLAYTDVVPDGIDDVTIDQPNCSTSTGVACPPQTTVALGPVVNADGTTTVGMFYDEVVGVPYDRYFSFRVHGHVMDAYTTGTRLAVGDQLVDRARGYSNEDDVITSTPSAPVESALYESDEATFATNVGEPDVHVEKTADRAGPLAAGDVINYTITVRNTGQVAAWRVPVEDRPNSALTSVTLTGDTWLATKGWVADDPTIAWLIPTLWPGQVQQFTYQATVGPDPQTEAAIENTVDVGVFQGRQYADDANREYDGPSDEVVIRFLSADLRLTKVPNPTGATPCPANDPANDSQQIAVGRSAPWCITVTNAGELLAGAVVARDMLPPGWTYDAGSATVDGVAVEPNITTLFGNTLLRWDLGDLASGASVVIRYSSTPGTGSAADSANSAWATAQRPDGSAPPAGAPGFRSADAANATLSSVGVEIAKTPDRQVLPFLPGGGRAHWDITVTNPAETDLTGLVVTDHFPDGVTYDPATTVSTCAGSVETASAATAAGQDVSWAFPSLAVGQTCTITVEAVVPAGLPGQTVFVNYADVDSDQTDAAAANLAKLVVYEPVTVGDFVWQDLDGDGVQDAGEPGQSGVDVTVSGQDVEGNPFTATFTTDATGHWTGEIPPGTFTVTLDTADLPAHWQFTHVGVGDPALDSDAGVGGNLGTISPASGEVHDGLDAGFVLDTGVIEGVRWTDADADGVREAGETPVAGETVTLTGTDMFGNPVSTTATTDVDGSYHFTGLLPGTYTVTFEVVPGLHVSTPLPGPIALQSGQTVSDVDEGTYALGSVAGIAWVDADGDGIRAATDVGLAGVEVHLVGTDGSGAAVDRTATTGSGGTVTFDDVVPGMYHLVYGAVGGSDRTSVDQGADDTADSDADRATGATNGFDMVSGADVSGVDAGYFVPVAIHGIAWDDADGDGVQDAGELPVAGVVVTLVGTDGAGNPVWIPATTGADGRYDFTGLVPGTYHLEVAVPSGTEFTVDGRGPADTDSDPAPATGHTAPVTLDSGDHRDHLDSGFFTPAHLGGVVWTDTDGDGVHDAGEPVLAGVEVHVTGTDGAGNPVDLTVTTDPSGVWAVDGLVPGDYSVAFGTPSGTVLTAPDKGSDDTLDSDPAAEGSTVDVTLTSGSSRDDIGAGYFTPGSVGGTVWTDLDGDGVRDAGEPGTPDVTVRLTGTDGAGNPVSIEVATGADGTYSFDDLVPGSYTVTVVAPPRRTITVPNAGADDVDSDIDPVTSSTPVVVTSGSSSTVDGGLVGGATLGGQAWTDRDGDGVHESGEPVRSGVVVRVTGTDGTGAAVTRETTTDADGNWSVGVPPGTYTVPFVAPAGTEFAPAKAATPTTDSDADPATGGVDPITVIVDDEVGSIDAGVWSPGTVSGRVWDDRNGNGVQDPGEPAIEGVEITLTGTDVNGNPVERTATTGPDGSWTITGLPEGDYEVAVTPPEGYDGSPVDAGDDDNRDSDESPLPVHLGPGETDGTIGHGFWRPAKLEGVVWDDVDRDGLRQQGEALHGGVPVELILVSAEDPGMSLRTAAAPTPVEPGEVIATSTTAEDGSYLFEDLAPGIYQVRIAVPERHRLTIPLVGGDRSIDSDMGLATAMTQDITVDAGDHIRAIDAGLWLPTDLTIKKTLIDGPTADRTVTYRVSVTNVGDQPTVGTVSVTDTLPTGLTPVSATGTGWTCDQRVTEVVCTLDSVIEPGATSDVTLVGTIAKGVTTDLTNRASVVSDDDLDNVVDSADEGTALVEAQAITRLDKNATPETPKTLAFTGGDIWRLLALAVAAISGGALLVQIPRRRRRSR